MSGERDYTVAAPHPMTFAWLGLPLLAASALAPMLRFYDDQPPFGPGIQHWLIPLLMLLVLLLLGLAYRRRRIRVQGQQLQIASTLYNKRVDISALQLEQARIVDLGEHKNLRPGGKSNGVQMPGFRSGHFRAARGGKAFCLITDNQRVLILPLHDGNRLYLSPENPSQLLRDLQTLAAGRHRH